MRHQSDNSPTTVGERVAAFLRRHHPVKTATAVWAETGIPEDTAEKLLERCSAPSTGNFLLMLEAYGPAFVTACLPNPPAWLSEAAHHARVDAARAAVAKAQADLERAVQAVRA